MLILENRIVSSTISLKPSITIFKKSNCLCVYGPLGHLFLKMPVYLEFQQTAMGFRFLTLKKYQPLLTTYISLLQQSLRGVEFGWFEVLVIQGVGWRVALEATQSLSFSLGYSHSIVYRPKPGIEVTLYSKQCFKIFGLDLVAVQQTVADICRLRCFNVYKGKGVCKQASYSKLKISSKSKA